MTRVENRDNQNNLMIKINPNSEDAQKVVDLTRDVLLELDILESHVHDSYLIHEDNRETFENLMEQLKDQIE